MSLYYIESMAKSLKRGKGSRKLVNKRRKSLKRGKGSRKSVNKSKGFRKIYGGTPFTEFLIRYDNKKLTSDQQAKLNEYLNNNSLIDKPNDEGITPLHVLCSQESLNRHIVEMLIKKGANVNAKTIDEYKYTPLDVLMQGKSNYHWNSYEPFKEIMTLLLEKGGLYNEKLLNPQKLNYIKNIQNKIQTDRKNQTESLKIGKNDTANPLHQELDE